MINSKRIFSNAVLSVVQVVVSTILLFFLYRYILNNLGSAQLGVWSLVLTSTSVARLGELGFTGAVVRFVAQHLTRGDQQKVSRIIQTAALTISALLCFILLAAYPVLTYVLSWAIPHPAITQAMEILPWAVLSLWFGMVAAVFQSALDGCQRMDIRNGILIFCNILYIGAVVWLVPSDGLKGLAEAQLIQSIVLFILSWWFLRRQVQNLPWLPSRWFNVEFKEMFGYAVHFQIANIAGLLFEPITKFLLSRYGDLSLVAYYEMASQVATKVKALLVSALQAMLPEIASIKDSDTKRLVNVYRQSYSLLFFVALPWCLMFALSLPLISILWIGHIEAKFILFGQILIIGGLLSTMGLPAYFVNLGSGKLAWNTAAQVSVGICNLAIGWIMGYLFGGVGVAVAAMLVYVMGHWILLIVVQRRLKVSINEVIPVKHRAMLSYLLAASIAVSAIYFELQSHSTDIVSASTQMLLFDLTAILIVLRHPYTFSIKEKVQSYLLKKWQAKQ